ncbi:MAG: hypothetical protein AAB839_02005 [Patescibacteria group bacterium]
MQKKNTKHHAHRSSSTEIVGGEAVESSDIDAGLSAIYGKERDDLKVVARGDTRLTRFLLRAVIVLAGVCLLTLLGYVIYQRFFVVDRDGKPLTMQFVVPLDLQSGAVTTIELGYANSTGYPLTAVEIDINLPAGFLLTTATPVATNIEDMMWNLGTIPARSDGKIIISGIWSADVPSTTGIQALASYKPANFNAQFNDIATATVTTNTSTLALTVDEVATANAGQAVTYVVHTKNMGIETITASTVALTLPNGFFVQSSDPTIIAGAAPIYTLSDLVPGAESIITVVGAYASDVSGTQTLLATASVGKDRKSVQATASTSTDVKGSALSLLMVGNGSEGVIAADPGSLLRVSLRIENTGDVQISDATALLDFTAEDNLPIEWSTAVLDGGKVTAHGITFDAKRIGSLAPGSHVTLNLAFPLKTDLSAVSSAFMVAFTATQAGITIQAPPLSVSLNSDVGLSSALRYYNEDGSPLGSGPLPPVVGSATHYRAIWSLSSGLHGLKDVSVSATLPEGVTWDDFATADGGTITYDATSRVIRWTMTSLPADAAEISARLSLSITPTEKDVGTAKTILGKTVLSAKDEETNAVIERSADAVTTECEGDVNAQGKGIVKAK